MPDGWTQAGTIGTWIAALLALVALVGVVGPYLVWRASKTARHQALDALEKGEAENGGFVTNGIRVSPSIRLFRKVRAPLLQREPHLPGRKLTWDSHARLATQESSGWVQLCLALKAYAIEVKVGDPLDVSDLNTWLPVHKNWILILGLAGRFGKRSDGGKLPMQPKRGVKSIQALPGRAFSMDRKMSKYGPQFWNWSNRRRGRAAVSDIIDSESNRFKPLSGLFGTFWLLDTTPSHDTAMDKEKAYYIGHRSEETGELAVDSLSIDALFWLSVGCLPSRNGDIFSLDNVENLEVEEDSQDSSNIHGHVRRGSIATLSPGVHFERDNSSNSDEDDYPRRRPSQYVISGSHRPKDVQSRPGRPRGFRLSSVNDRVEALASVANSIEAEGDQATIYSLEELDLTEDICMELEESSGYTYLPIQSQWVRLGRESQNQGIHHLMFLERPAAQKLAQLLLDLPITPDGYLMNANRDSLCRATLCNAAQSLPHLLGRIINDIDSLGIPADSRDHIVTMLDSFLDKILTFTPNRPFFCSLYDIDCVLQTLIPIDPMVATAVGVLMLTSAEFRAIIVQSARLIQVSIDKTVDLAFGHRPLFKVPSVMGVTQEFPVDFEALFPAKDLALPIVKVKFQDIMFSALKACLKSAVLETSLDSGPLFEAFMNMSEKVYVG
jgi:hypothetical protein